MKMYNKTVMSRFSKPRFAGNVKKPEAVAEVTNLDCGDVVKISARIDEKEVIREAKFKAFGSVATIASCDVACYLMIGKTLST